MSEFMLIDGSLMAYRYYEAMPDLSSSTGIPTGLEYGLLRGLESLQKKFPDAKIVMVWDSPKAKGKKQKIDPLYKANRPKGDKSDLWSRLKKLRSRVLDHRWAHASLDGVEADEVMHSISRELGPLPNAGGPSTHLIMLYTNDEDMLQSVTQNTIVLKSWKSKLYEWDEDKVSEKFEVSPLQLPLLRACLGDKSDNLPGCGCLGQPKLAQAVREAFKTAAEKYQAIAGPADLIQNIKDNHMTWFGPKTEIKWNDFVGRGQLRRNYELMTIKHNPNVSNVLKFKRNNEDHVKTVLWTEPTYDDVPVAEALAEWEIKSLRMCKEVFAKAEDDEEF